LSCYGCLDMVLHCSNSLFLIHLQASWFLVGTIWTFEEAHKVGVCLSVPFFLESMKDWVLCSVFIICLLWFSCRTYRPRDLSNRFYASDEARQDAIERAEQVESGLGSDFPTFLKPMLQSHVTGGFWLVS